MRCVKAQIVLGDPCWLKATSGAGVEVIDVAERTLRMRETVRAYGWRGGSGGKNLARNLATPHGTKRKKGLQGTCKVSFFGILRNRSETKFRRYFSCLRRKIPEAAR